jgi:small subunit ribosomal protein S19e
MVSAYDINPTELINKAAIELKKTKGVQIPDWAYFIKTGAGKERVPDSKDWWYVRAGSILRKVYVKGPIGVSKLRTFYGCKKNRGVKPEKFYKASGKVIRTILQQLEAEGLIKAVEKGVHKGKIVTPKGRSFLDTLVRKKDGTRGAKKAKDAGAAKPGDAKPESGKAETAGTT